MMELKRLLLKIEEHEKTEFFALPEVFDARHGHFAVLEYIMGRWFCNGETLEELPLWYKSQTHYRREARGSREHLEMRAGRSRLAARKRPTLNVSNESAGQRGNVEQTGGGPSAPAEERGLSALEQTIPREP